MDTGTNYRVYVFQIDVVMALTTNAGIGLEAKKQIVTDFTSG